MRTESNGRKRKEWGEYKRREKRRKALILIRKRHKREKNDGARAQNGSEALCIIDG